MAIIKAIEVKGGAEADYWVIVDLHYTSRYKGTTATLWCYLSVEARDESEDNYVAVETKGLKGSYNIKEAYAAITATASKEDLFYKGKADLTTYEERHPPEPEES